MQRSLLLIFLLFASACNKQIEPKQPQIGPQQVLVFRATPLVGQNSIDLDRTKQVITARLNAAELKCGFRLQQSGSQQFELITYGAAEPELDKIKKYVISTATLEFAPLADPREDAELIAAAKDVVGEVKIDDVVRGAWMRSKNAESNGADDLHSVDAEVVREREVDGKMQSEWLVAYDPQCRITGDQLIRAGETQDHKGAPALSFEIGAKDVWRMQHTTSRLRPFGNKYRLLAIIWDGRIVSAPRVQSQISGHGMIQGIFSREEVKEMSGLLSAGQLPCLLEFEKPATKGQ